MKTDPNDPAMPMLSFNDMGGVGQACEPGLTKREYFAAKAMEGMLMGAPGSFAGDKIGNTDFSAYRGGACNKAIVDRAVVIADDLIARLNGEPDLAAQQEPE